jgi:predicted NAD-dependent protein-ADP-ribosyltransferase YbiA (DUF1768 family)
MNDVFQFRFTSRPAKPGYGAGERTGGGTYMLPVNFRQILSNFYLTPIEYKGERYASVEHAFHAAKLKRFGKHALAARFAVGGDVGNGADVKRAGGKNGLYRMTLPEIDVWKRESCGILAELWEEKFGRNPALRAVLKETKRAELWHDMGRGKKERWVELEELRARL